ncbi:MAG: hypothetical protein ACI8X5_002963 [Planctomycetota bacterium]|jgi:hypothetical protein
MKEKLLLPFLVLALVVLGGGLWTLLGDEQPVESDGLRVAVDSNSSNSREADLLPAGDTQLSTMVRLDKDLSTTVIIPLKLTFEITNAKALLDDDQSPALGSAASAKLRGSIHGSDGLGVDGYVEFVAGPNKGRVIDANEQGMFGANDLLSGLSLVIIGGPSVPVAEREVLLRENRETQLNIGFGRPATVRGSVRDRQNNPIPTASVTMDGKTTKTDENGLFYFSRITSGKVPVYVSKTGYADYREMTSVTAGMVVPPGKIKYTLAKEAILTVVIPERVGTGPPGQLYITGGLDRIVERKFPWHLKSPVSLFGGETIEIGGLAAGPIRLQYFRAGTEVTPPIIHDTLVAGSKRTVTFHLKAAPVLVGVVKMEGKPFEGALVRLEAPDVTGASVSAMRVPFGRATLEMGLLSQMPPAVQTSVTGVSGAFQFSAAEHLSAVRYLTAKSPDGKSWAGSIVRVGENNVELHLKEAVNGKAGFLIETSTRFQALPVQYVVNGKPSVAVLAPGERLSIPNLPEGDWKVSASWGGESIMKDVTLQISETEELFLPLPKGAIEGQSKSMRESMGQQ